MQTLISRLGCLALAFAMLSSTARAADDSDAIKKKIQDLNKVTGTETLRTKAIELVKDKANTVKLLKTADDMAKLDSKQFQYNAAFILALAAQQVRETDIALRFFRICEKKARDVKSSNKLVESFEGQFSILYERKKYEEAEDLCKKILEEQIDEKLDQMKPFIMEQLVQTQTKQGKVEEALKMTDTLIKLDEGGWYFVRLKAWVQQETGKGEEAAKSYLESIERLEKSDRLKPEEQERWIDRTRYILSNVYVELNQVDKAADQLKTLLKKKPDSPTYNNDLGYIWADHDMNLDESEKLIRKAIEEDRKQRKAVADLPPDEDKDNSAYLDSLGWVLYKKKNFKEAKKHLLEAVKDKDGQHLEIMDHLADVHMALGEKTEAIAVWKKALETEVNNKRDIRRRVEVMKKLKAAEGK